MKRWQSVLDGVTSLAMLVAAGLLIYGSWPRVLPAKTALPLPSAPIAIDNAILVGDAAAPIAIVEFSDFECPFCRRHAREVAPDLRRLYIDSGVAKIAFRHLPLERIHRFAKAAAEVAECAARQDRFVAMYDALFDRSDWTASGQVLSLASELGLKQDRLQDCVTSEAAAKIESDGEVARKLGISVTPTFLIGSVAADGTVQVSTRLSGLTPLSGFQEAIEQARTK